jgi:hypothetical protein
MAHGAERIEIQIFDVSGRTVRELLLPTPCSLLPAGITWDGRDDAGKVLPPGIYFIVLNSEGYQTTRKLLFVR